MDPISLTVLPWMVSVEEDGPRPAVSCSVRVGDTQRASPFSGEKEGWKKELGGGYWEERGVDIEI